jgi:NADH-quinone oxidoreductase subunit C
MILEAIKAKFLDEVLSTSEFRGDLTATVTKEILVDLIQFLKKDPALDFNVLMDLTAVDYLARDRKPRFDVVYHLYSLLHKHRVRVKVGIEENQPEINSLTSIWPAANWFEREVWDMFGIRFLGHPELKRILMYESFEGHPLRKDYPVNKRQPLILQKTDQELENTEKRNPSVARNGSK